MSDHFYYTQLARTGDRPFLIRKFMELGFTESASNYALIISIILTFVVAIGIALYSLGFISTTIITGNQTNDPMFKNPPPSVNAKNI